MKNIDNLPENHSSSTSERPETAEALWESLSKQLNPAQLQAVEYIDGASLVIAGAGSGKTRVLTYKIAYLLTQGYKPWEIMALTFTNKAANEMKERVSRLVGESAYSLQMGTFHSVFSRILRREASLIGYDSNFTIYDEADSRSLCKNIVKTLGLDDKIYKPAEVHNRISMAKNKLILPAQYAENTNIMVRDRQSNMDRMPAIYSMYVDNCRKSNAMDFDDLLVYTFRLFHENPEVRDKYRERYRFVLVDEYQDTNYVQQQIVWQLTGGHQHVCVVGDDAQSIYGFRGANIDNILDFQEQYDGSRMFKLEQNYRSTQNIVKAANSLIKHNCRQIEKDVFSQNSEGEKLRLRVLSSDKEEAISICKDIKRAVKSEGKHYSDFAILYRTNYQSRTFEEQMLKDNIPYKIYGGMSFYQRKEIKDVIAYFRLVVNHHDEEAFRRIINYPARGIGDTTVNKIVAGAQERNVSLWTVAQNPLAYGVEINKGTINKLSLFCQMIEGFSQRLNTDDAYELGKDIIKMSGITADIYSGTNADDTSRQENLEELVNSMQDFVEDGREEELPVGLTDFLQDVSLMTDRQTGDDDDNDKVSMMTIHSAKGLEFPTVYVVGMEENIFPSPMCTDSMRLLEEERRLFYVAITRAENSCVLTCAKTRFRYGRMEFDAPSRFLKDIDPRLIEMDSNSSEIGSCGRSNRNNYGSSSSSRYSNGRMQNSHPVASQFMADPKPKVTEGRKAETPVNPFSPAFERELEARGGNLRKVREALSVGTNRSSMLRGSSTMDAPSASSKRSSVTSSAPANIPTLSIGDKIEHNRFGVGVVTNLSGEGPSAKATVDFQNAGTKQLLLKFAKIVVLS